MNTMQDDGVGKISSLNTDINGTYLSNLSISGSTMKRMLQWFGGEEFRVVRIYLDTEGVKHYIVEYDKFNYINFYEKYKDGGKLMLIVDSRFTSKGVKFC